MPASISRISSAARGRPRPCSQRSSVRGMTHSVIAATRRVIPRALPHARSAAATLLGDGTGSPHLPRETPRPDRRADHDAHGVVIGDEWDIESARIEDAGDHAHDDALALLAFPEVMAHVADYAHDDLDAGIDGREHLSCRPLPRAPRLPELRQVAHESSALFDQPLY